MSSLHHSFGRSLCSALVAALAAAGCGVGGVCGEPELTAALGAAREGDVVEVGDCTVAGAFTLPGGVTLRGAGNGAVLRSVEGGAPVITIGTGSPARVESLTIEVHHGGIGLRAVGTGAPELRGLDVRVERGVAIGLGSLTSATIVDLDLIGPITRANAATAPMTPDLTGTFGLVTRDVAMLSLESVRARGFALAAISIERGRATWVDRDDATDVHETRGVGVALFGAEATLDGLEVGAMLGAPGLPGVAIGAMDDAGAPSHATAERVTIEGGDGYGFFADASDLVLATVEVRDLVSAGICLQGGSLVGSDLVVERNGGAGVLAIDTTSVSIQRASLGAHRQILYVAASGPTASIGDGIHVVRESGAAPPVDLSLVDVEVVDNVRVGLIVDAADTAPARFELTRVLARAEGMEAYGVIAQRATMLPATWESGVTREGSALANDASAPMLDIAGIVMPPAAMARAPAF
jgi:hypothetical protein